jgi:hypothetical protein
MVSVPGSDLEPTRTGWRLRTGVAGVERLVVRRRGGRVVVSLRGLLPPFALIDGAGAGSVRGTLHWRMELGALCAQSVQLTCTDDREDERRCTRARVVRHRGRAATP